MADRSLRDFIAKLEAAGELVRVSEPVSSVLEITGIHRRLLAHVIFGISIVVLLLALGIPARLAQRHRALSGVLSLLLLVVTAVQVWLGILMIYDSHSGPLTRFADRPPQTTLVPTAQTSESANQHHPQTPG